MYIFTGHAKFNSYIYIYFYENIFLKKVYCPQFYSVNTFCVTGK